MVQTVSDWPKHLPETESLPATQMETGAHTSSLAQEQMLTVCGHKLYPDDLATLKLDAELSPRVKD